MKVNLKTTNEENAAATSTCHQRGQRTVNGVIGNTRRGIVIDKTLDPDSNNPVANKPVSTALVALAGKIDAALQKPTGLTKTKLVGVGASGQENIEIGDNLTLTNGKLAASGGNIPIVEGTIDETSSETAIIINIPQAQTEPFILHIEEMQSYILMSVIMGAYLGYLYEGRNEKVAYIFQGSGTTIDVSITNPIVPIVNATNTDDYDRYTIPNNQESAFILQIVDSSGKHDIFMSASNDGTLYYYYGIEDITSNSITYLYGSNGIIHGSNSIIQRHRIEIPVGSDVTVTFED